MQDRDIYAARATNEAHAGARFATLCPRDALCCSPQSTGVVCDPGRVSTLGSSPAALQLQDYGRRFDHVNISDDLRDPTNALITSRREIAPNGNNLPIWPYATHSSEGVSRPVDGLSGLAPRHYLSSCLTGGGLLTGNNTYDAVGFSNITDELLDVTPVSDAGENYPDPHITGGRLNTTHLAEGFYGLIDAPLNLSQGNGVYESYRHPPLSGGVPPGLRFPDGGFSYVARPMPAIISNEPDMLRRGLVFSCHGYPLSDALYPTPQYASLRQQLSSTYTFAGLDSDKISVRSTQPLRAFERYQVRIRTRKGATSDDLHQVVFKISRHLEERGATVGELSDWYLTDIVKTKNGTRSKMFEFHFRVPNVGGR